MPKRLGCTTEIKSTACVDPDIKIHMIQKISEVKAGILRNKMCMPVALYSNRIESILLDFEAV